jgi:hypothetical protein
MNVFVFGVDVSTRCGPLSNVVLIYFVWQNFERISSKQYATALIPSDIESRSPPPKLMCLKYYRADSDGWKDAANCDTCVEQYQTTVGTQCDSSLPELYFCTICLRQPPSLFGSALHIYTKLVHNLVRFELTPDTTYEQYVYANESKQVNPGNLLPPEFPEVRIWFTYDHPDFEQKFHRDCPGAGAWHAELCHTFPSVAIAIHSLASEEETYWCPYSGRGLFSPTRVPIRYV